MKKIVFLLTNLYFCQINADSGVLNTDEDLSGQLRALKQKDLESLPYENVSTFAHSATLNEDIENIKKNQKIFEEAIALERFYQKQIQQLSEKIEETKQIKAKALEKIEQLVQKVSTAAPQEQSFLQENAVLVKNKIKKAKDFLVKKWDKIK